MGRRVLLVSNFFPPRAVGGAEIVVFRQARALAALGHEVTILAGTESSDVALQGALEFDRYDGLRVYRLGLRSLDPSLNFFWPSAARRLCSLIAANDIEIVHLHNLPGLGANLIPAAKTAKTRCLVTLHDPWGFCYRQTRLRADHSVCNAFDECARCLSGVQASPGVTLPMRLRRDYVAWCVGRADRLFTPSCYLKQAYVQAGFPQESITVLSNGIDLDNVPAGAKAPSADGVVRFLCSAYLGEHKGIMVLLEAAERLLCDPEASSGWRLTIAGEGHLRAAIEAKLQAAKLGEKVRLAGRLPRSELLDRHRETDVAVLASVVPENEPVSMLEAIASGTAQIATRIGGIPELVEDARSGFLVEPNSPGALAEAMRRYILDPTLARRHGDRNRERRKEFDETPTITALDAILADRGQPAAAASRAVVICGCGQPPAPVAECMGHFHEHFSASSAVSFLWHEWADHTAWTEAKLLWLWDQQPAEWLINTALRCGVPVLAPANRWTEGIARHYGGVILYGTFLEAMAAICPLLSQPALHAQFAWRARAAGAAATVLAPKTAFHVTTEAIC